MSILKIDSALASSFIGAGTFGLPTQWPNEEYKPVDGLAWAKYSFVPAEPGNDTISQIGRDRYTGFVQVDVNYPVAEGRRNASLKADQIRAYFSANKHHIYDDQAVLVTRIGVSQGRIVDGWYRISVSVFWRSNITH